MVPSGGLPASGERRWWHARDTAGASRVVGLLIFVGSVWSLLLVTVVPHTVLGDRVWAFHAAWFTSIFGLLASLPAVLLPHRCPRWGPLVLSVLAAAMVGWLNWVTKDLSFGAQVYMMWPALFASYHLRRIGAWIVAGTTTLFAAVVSHLLGGSPTALIDLVAFGMTAAVVTIAMTVNRDRAEQFLDKLTEEARLDPLTGLATRRVFDDALAEALAGGRGFTVLLSDVDEFKRVNDGYGHQTGDVVLRTVADELRGACREGDVVARLGGDEFVALLLGPATEEAMTGMVVAERFRAGVHGRRVRTPGGDPLQVTVSIGLAHRSGGLDVAPEDARQLLARVDLALYDAKRAGRDRVAVGGF